MKKIIFLHGFYASGQCIPAVALCEAFYAQMVAPVVGIPALLGNPHFRMTDFLKQRIGEHQYKSPRKDGNQNFVIDEALIDEFAEMEAIQFNTCNPDFQDRKKLLNI